ncbi:WYL domain-containing protein [[Haemophilus] felis]|nr:WYL domain-containing protein [[Haemophilus] felis]
MTTRTTNLDATLYLIEMLKLIPKHSVISAPELKEKLEEIGFKRDIRSIQRTLKTLCEHFDIECDDRSKPYGYRWKSHSSGMSVVNLSIQQSLVLKLAEQQLKYMLPPNIMAYMKPFFEEANYLVSEARDKPEYQWLGKVKAVPTSQPLIPAKLDENVFNTVSQALFQNKMLNIEYCNQIGKIHQARVMPLALAPQGATIYLVVRYEGFEDNRLLALHRIQSAEMSTFSFERPADFNLKIYQEKGYLAFGEGTKVRLTFTLARWAGFHLTETPLSEDQIILEQTDDYYRFQATVADTMMLNWWLRRFGDDIWDIEKEPI